MRTQDEPTVVCPEGLILWIAFPKEVSVWSILEYSTLLASDDPMRDCALVFRIDTFGSIDTPMVYLCRSEDISRFTRQPKSALALYTLRAVSRNSVLVADTVSQRITIKAERP